MSVLLTNDDGIDAPGLAALWTAVQVADGPWDSVLTVAPQSQWSGCGHQVTTLGPIAVDHRSSRSIAVNGTPADCVRLGLEVFGAATSRVTWVLSGINAGGNMGADIYISGTVAAVREAAFHRVPGIAFSHYRHGATPFNWEAATRWVSHLLPILTSQALEPGQYWNVNLPHLDPGARDPEIVFCDLCTQPLPTAYQLEGTQYRYVGRYGERRRDPGADTDVCLSGGIAITRLSVAHSS